VEAVGRTNLLALDYLGYTGASATAIKNATEAGTLSTLLLQDSSGQAPCGGRTDDHCWVDAGYQGGFETMAELENSRGHSWVAGQYRHAALLAFNQLSRWQRSDGSFYVTKNKFDPSLRIGYQDASQYSAYNGSLIFHTAESYEIRQSSITENPAPAEIGGYALATDSSFGAAFANAGGVMMELHTRGDTSVSHSNYWCALGVERFSRVNWDTRLGPSDGQRGTSSGLGVSFAPTWMESGSWVRMASVPNRYQGTFTTTMAHPLLTKCSVAWAPKSGQTGPSFKQDFTLTPDGIFVQTTETSGTNTFGVTYPLLQFDGATTLTQSVSGSSRIAAVSYPSTTDEQNFILINTNAPALASDAVVRSSYGDLTPVRATTSDSQHRTFIYPRVAADPSASSVRDSFAVTANGFASSLGSVNGTLYIGRTSAGGVGSSIDLNADGVADATFSASCGFILQLNNGAVTSVETDSAVTATIQGHPMTLTAFTPATVPTGSGTRYEAESLAIVAVSTGVGKTVSSDPRFSNGAALYLNATAANQFITLDVPNIAAGTYDVRVGIKKWNNKGAWQCAIQRLDGVGSLTNVGPAIDEYDPNEVFTEVDLGSWKPGSTNDKAVTFTVTGKNAASSSYQLAIDYITFIPQ
jgi:hypothetical protein